MGKCSVFFPKKTDISYQRSSLRMSRCSLCSQPVHTGPTGPVRCLLCFFPTRLSKPHTEAHRTQFGFTTFYSYAFSLRELTSPDPAVLYHLLDGRPTSYINQSIIPHSTHGFAYILFYREIRFYSLLTSKLLQAFFKTGFIKFFSSFYCAASFKVTLPH